MDHPEVFYVWELLFLSLTAAVCWEVMSNPTRLLKGPCHGRPDDAQARQAFRPNPIIKAKGDKFVRA